MAGIFIVKKTGRAKLLLSRSFEESTTKSTKDTKKIKTYGELGQSWHG